jgi:predicted transposase YbfD/YdcC
MKYKCLNALDLKGVVLTIDAMGGQKSITQQIIKPSAAYVLGTERKPSYFVSRCLPVVKQRDRQVSVLEKKC